METIPTNEQLKELEKCAMEDTFQREAELSITAESEKDNEGLEENIFAINRAIFLPHVNAYFKATGLKAIIADGRTFLGKDYPLGKVAFISWEGLALGVADEGQNWNQNKTILLTPDHLTTVDQDLSLQRIKVKISEITERIFLRTIRDIINNPGCHFS